MTNQDQILSDSATMADDPAPVASERRGRVSRFVLSIINYIMGGGGGGGQDETMPLSPDPPTSSQRPLCRHRLNRLDDHRRHTRSRTERTLAG